MTNNLLTVNNLNVTFSMTRGNKSVEIKAVRNVSFNLERGKILGIVGESGSGKSVSTTAILGLLPQNAEVSGSIIYDNNNLTQMTTKELRQFRGRKIGMIFQEPSRSFDPLQNLESVFFETFRNQNPKITKQQSIEKAIELLNEVGLTNSKERLSNFPHQFSGGQLQRISIALSLAQGCNLLIADEPTTALDVTIQKQIVQLLKHLQTEKQLSIIFISHNIDLVSEISDDIIVMYGGMIMERGNTKTVLSNPIHPYTKALIKASPVFGTNYKFQKLEYIPGKVTDPANPEIGCPFEPRCSKKSEKCKSTNFMELDCYERK